MTPPTGDINNLNYSVISFYGFVPKDNTLAEFYSRGVRWFNELGAPPKWMGTKLGKGLQDFNRVSKKAMAAEFSIEQIQHVSLRSKPFNSAVPAGACEIECCIRTNPRTYMFLSTCLDSLSLPSDALSSIARDLAELLSPEYGVGFRRIHAWGPAFYAVGLGVGVKAPDELNQVINFRETTWSKHYLKGHLGGIFPWNFLTAPQLQASVNGTSLERWIQAAPHRGSLEPFTSKMSLWSVPEEDIPAVYKDLWEANVVFDYERFCNARWEQSKSTAKPESTEEVLGKVLKAYGYDSSEEAQILKVEKLGEVRELSEEEAKDIITNRKNPPQR